MSVIKSSPFFFKTLFDALKNFSRVLKLAIPSIPKICEKVFFGKLIEQASP
jgi:hypothetical protein